MNETDKNSDKKEKIGDATLVSDDQNIDTEIEEDTNEEQIIKVNENCYEIFYKKAEDELQKIQKLLLVKKEKCLQKIFKE